jgi:4-amino-4-deoxy-L-arabinose transferase-like glycosyltransferase
MSPTLQLLALAAAVAASAAIVLAWRRQRQGTLMAKAKVKPAAPGSPTPPRSRRRTAGDLRPGVVADETAQSQPAGEPITRPTNLAWIKPEAVLLLGGLLLTVFGQVTLEHAPLEARRTPALILGLGLAVFLVGGALAQGSIPRWPRWQAAQGITRWLGITAGQACCLLLAPVFAIIAGMAAGLNEKMTDPVVGMWAWALAILLVVMGSWPSSMPRWSPSWKIMGPALGLFLAALLIRGIQTTTIPQILTGDEGSAGLSAYGWVKGTANNPFVVGWYSFPSLYFMLQSFSIRLLGTTTEAIRLTSALVGALTVPALYLVARPWLGNRAAFLAALYLAAFHFHVNFSRIALNNVWDGLGYVIVLGALVHGWRTGRRASFALAGLVLGLLQYFYPSSRLLILLVAAWLVAAAILDRRRLRAALPNLGLMGLAATIPVIPLVMFYVRFPNEFLAPLSRFSVLGEWMKNELVITGDTVQAILLRQFSLGFQAFTATPLRHWYMPGTPILREVPAALFLAGLALMLLRLRDERIWLIGLWLAAFGAAGALSESTPASQRYVSVAPAVCLVVAYGVDTTGQYLVRLWPRLRKAIPAVSILLVAALAVDDLRFYFLEYTPNSQFGGDNGWVAQKLGSYLREFPDTTYVAFFGAPRMGFGSIPSLQYLAPQVDGTDMPYAWGSPENPPVSGRPLLYAFLPEREVELRAAMAALPDGELVQMTSPTGGPLVWVYLPP